MSELLTSIAKSLVNNPDEVVVNKSESGNTISFELSVASEDMGKIIGKNGKRAQAIRSIMKAKYARDGKRVIVDILDQQ